MTEGEILRALESSGVGTGKFDESKVKTAYQDMILALGNGIIQDFRSQIEKDTKSNNGSLKSSIVPIPTSTGFDIEADYYYKFIDDGVSGVGQFMGSVQPSRAVVSNGLYQFKNLGVPEKMVASIREWSGASISQSYAIAVNIKNYGIKPKNITDKVVTDELLDRVADDILKFTGLVVGITFDNSFPDK